VATSLNNNAVALRGLLIAMIVLGLCIAVFALVANQGRIRTPEFVDRIVSMMSTPAPPKAPRKARETPSGQIQDARPGAGAGKPAGGAPQDAFPPARLALHDGPAPTTAAQALHEVLRRYRKDPKHTATVTISSSGQITESAPGALTVHDGLPVEAINGSTELIGSGPGASAAP
jgi:hypothetical protein